MGGLVAGAAAGWSWRHPLAVAIAYVGLGDVTNFSLLQVDAAVADATGVFLHGLAMRR